MKSRLLILGLLATLLTGCSLDDDRDECCYQVRLHFHETIDGIDLFKQDIRIMRHMLFDSDGRFVEWLPSPMDNSQDVDIDDLPEGDYTVITVANATDKTIFENYDNISTFRLVHGARHTRADEDNYANSDELYWHMASFTIDHSSKIINCPLSNIHCHLHVKAVWKGVPRQVGKWTMRLYDVFTEYRAGETGLDIVGWTFPMETDAKGTHAVETSVFNFELECEFTTFRWTNAGLPALQLLCNGEPATARMDLGVAFQEWGWFPDRAKIQDYWIDLIIDDDGTVEMRPGGSIGIHDWVDGGTISN